MPAIGRLLAALTGVVPQKTVNPDEAVALGCAVHAAVLDGMEGMGTVLSPMQAAILRAVAEQQGIGNDFDDDDEDFDDGDEEEFSNTEPN
jgi:molecular chaperone DnaK (HSP70)